MVFWITGLLATLGLVWFVGAVVLPYAQVRWAIRDLMEHADTYEDNHSAREHYLAVVGSLGGSEAAIRKVRFYLRLPRPLAPHPEEAVGILGDCGPAGFHEAFGLMDDQAQAVRERAGLALLGMMEFEDDWGLDQLSRSLKHEDPAVRRRAASALEIAGTTGYASREKVQALLKPVTADPDTTVRAAAAEALKKIRGEEAGK
jgi:hypothetical protein